MLEELKENIREELRNFNENVMDYGVMNILGEDELFQEAKAIWKECPFNFFGEIQDFLRSWLNNNELILSEGNLQDLVLNLNLSLCRFFPMSFDAKCSYNVFST